MKRFIVMSLIGVCFALTVGGCGGRKNPAPQFVILESDTSFTRGNCNFEFKYSYEHIADAGNSRVLASIEERLPSIFFSVLGDSDSLPAGGDFETLAAAYRNRMVDMMGDLSNAGFTVGCTAIASSRASLPADSIMQYEVNGYSYTGGAHGMSYDMIYHFSLSDGRNLDINDFYTAAQLPELDKAIRARLAQQYGVPEDSLATVGFFAAEVDDLKHNDNFRLTADSITFVYNRYQIAPYSMGCIEVTLPREL